jgi:hypothetical protein
MMAEKEGAVQIEDNTGGPGIGTGFWRRMHSVHEVILSHCKEDASPILGRNILVRS